MTGWRKWSVLGLWLASSWSMAATPAHTAAAEQLLTVVRADQLTLPVYLQVRQAFEQRFAEAKAPGREAMLERYQAQANVVLDREVGWAVLKPQVIALYTEAFSQQELEELLAFYRSPLGEKVLRNLPQLTAAAAQLTQDRVFKAAPEVNRLLEQMSSELSAKPAQ